jgi:uncharacterized membrane protein
MSQIAKRISIHAPAAMVWQVLADFGSAEKWAPTVDQSRCSSENQRGVGARRVLRTSTGHVTEERVTAWNEGHAFTFEIPDGLPTGIVMLRETWSVENSTNGTDVAVTMDYQMQDGAIYRILERLMVGRVLKNMLVQNLAGLKHHIETGEAVSRETSKLPVAAVR